MASDFSPSGLEAYGFPSLTLDSLERGGDPRVLGWLREAVQEGDRINRSDPAYDQMEAGMAYVAGFQKGQTAPAQGQPAYIPQAIINECRRVVQTHTSLLTDLKPLFAYKAMQPELQLQADVLNRLTVASWTTGMMDLALGDCVKYALCAGTGDMITEWNPYVAQGGDIRLSARDARDSLAIRPATHDRSVQAWQGCILREAHSVNALRSLYPDRANLFRPTTDSLLSTLMGRFRQTIARLVSPAADTLSGLQPSAAASLSRVRSGDILLYRTYLTDRSKNLTTKSIPMGVPGSAWAYVVQPGEYLYPYKRLIVSTPELILYDGPSTDWHGQYPLSRLKLWDLPWHFLGLSILNDLLPIQDGINSNLQGLLLGIQQWLAPQVKYNSNAVSSAFMRTYDPRRPASKVKLNVAGAKEGFEKLEGPPAQVLALVLEGLRFLTEKFENNSGTPNLQALLALRQLPGAETLQKYWESMTPELRQEGRQIEAFLRDVAEQSKVLRFQYESNARRIAVVGDAGLLLQDFEFTPDMLVPSMQMGTSGYVPQLDASLSRDARAQWLAKQLVFTIQPNSILAMNATEQKLMRLQLARGGMYDFWSLLESLEVPNVGAPPAIPLPPLTPIDPAQLLVENQAAIAAGQPPLIGTKYLIDPLSGQVLEVRVPQTVTERLMAQQQLGLGMTENPAGRKASGQAPPKVEEKDGGTRSTVTES